MTARSPCVVPRRYLVALAPRRRRRLLDRADERVVALDAAVEDAHAHLRPRRAAARPLPVCPLGHSSPRVIRSTASEGRLQAGEVVGGGEEVKRGLRSSTWPPLEDVRTALTVRRVRTRRAAVGRARGPRSVAHSSSRRRWISTSSPAARDAAAPRGRRRRATSPSGRITVPATHGGGELSDLVVAPSTIARGSSAARPSGTPSCARRASSLPASGAAQRRNLRVRPRRSAPARRPVRAGPRAAWAATPPASDHSGIHGRHLHEARRAAAVGSPRAIRRPGSPPRGDGVEERSSR